MTIIGRPADHSSNLARGELADPEVAERFEAEAPEGHMRRREFLARTAALAGSASLATLLPADQLVAAAAARQQRLYPLPSPRDMPLDTIVVLMMENRSFDHYFGWHPTADARNHFSYPDPDGNTVATHRLVPDFQGCSFRDPDHSWEGGRFQWSHGAMNGFVMGNRDGTGSDAFAAGYYLEPDLPFSPHLAAAYTLHDRYFCSLMASTWPNRHYMWSAQSGGVKDNGSPADAIGPGLTGQGLYPWETIMNRAIGQGVSFRYYYSDLPFGSVYGRDTVLQSAPVSEYYLDAALGRLPQIAFVDPSFLDGGGGKGLSGDEHPHGDIRLGQAFISDVVHAFLESPQYKRGALFVNYDEWGGFFEHVQPRFVPDDRESKMLSQNFGMTGFRIPGISVSPWTRGGHVSHQFVTHESILKLISYRFGLGYLNKRHRYATNIGRSFDWTHPDLEPPELPDPNRVLTTPCGLPPAASAAAPAAHPHGDMRWLEASGYLDSVGAKISHEPVFRHPDAVAKAVAHAGAA